MSSVVDFVFSVGGIVTALLAGVIWLWRRPQSRAPRAFLLTVTIFYGLASTYAVGQLFNRLLTSPFHPFAASDAPPGRVAIVVMGSGSYMTRDWDDNAYSMPDFGGASRVLEAVRVFRLAHPEVIVSSGGKVDPNDRHDATAIVIRDALIQLGVPGERIVLQTASRNTYEEAVDDTKLLRSLNVDHVIVVTSDFHMRRTLGAFRAAGLTPIPAIARFPYELETWSRTWLPGDLGLAYSSLLVHEVIGIAYYAARGWFRS